MKTRVALTCIAALCGLPAAATDLASENKRILDHFFEDPTVTPAQMRQVLTTVYQQKKLEVDSLQIRGAPIPVPHTRVRVKGHNPPCGNNDKSAQQQISDAFMAGGAAMISAAKAGGPGAPVIAAIGAAIGAIGLALGADEFQEVSNCSVSCSAVPGHYERDELAKIVSVAYSYGRGDGSDPKPIDPGDDGDWFVAENWVTDKRDISVEPGSVMHGATLIKQGLELSQPSVSTSPITCPVTMVCSRIKNWSSNLDRSLAVTVTTDIRQIATGACLDASLVNRERYGKDLVKSLPGEYTQKYYADMRKRIEAQPR